MRLSVKILLLIALPLFSKAQVNPLFIEPTAKQVDSLKILAMETRNDTIRMAAFRNIALYYLEINSDSTIRYTEQEIPIAEKFNLKLWNADALDLYSIALSNTGKFTKALRTFSTAMQIAEDKASEKNIWRIATFTTTGIPANARLSLLAAIQLDFGGLYRSTQNFDQQRQMHKECIKTASLINDFTIITVVYTNLASLYRNLDQPDSALYFYKTSLNYSARCGYKKYNGTSFNGMGRIYLQQRKLSEAKQCLDSALALSLQFTNNVELAEYYSLMSEWLSQTGKTDSTLYYAQQGLAIAKGTSRTSSIIFGYTELVNIYQKQNKFDSAFSYLQLADALKDSLNSSDKIKQFQNIGFDEQLKLQELEKEKIKTQNKIRTYAMLGGLGLILLIAVILYRNNRQKQKTNKVLGKTLSDLRSTQTQLIQSEKMASLGELTAGIAHEIQNPLNFVNNFSEVNKELLAEMSDEIGKGNFTEVETIAKDVIENEEKINHHGKRADAIVKGMLQHSRISSGDKEPTDINALCDEYLRLAYHGLRAKDHSFNATVKTDLDNAIGKINIIPQDIGRVILNLLSNAFYVVDEKKKSGFDNYEPTVSVGTKRMGDKVRISVTDNGNGIPKEVMDKIFQPFFTTKPTGQGTGLGLSLSYDIITKGHGGKLVVNTKENEGTTFTITLPT